MRTLTSSRNWLLVLVTAGLTSIIPQSLRADAVSVTATFNSSQSQPNATYTTYLTSNYNDSLNGTSTDPTVDVYAGIYNFTVNSIAGDSSSTPLTLDAAEAALGDTQKSLNPTNDIFQAVCIDFTHNITFNQQSTWEVENLSSVDNTDNGVAISTNQANAIGYLVNHYYPLSALNPTDPEDAAVYQMAVWKLVYGSTYSSATPSPTVSFAGGTVSTSDITTAASEAAAAWNAVTLHGYTASNVYALVDQDDTQDFQFAILGTSGSSMQPVPLPATAGVGFSMLAGFGALAAFRKRLGRRSPIA